MPGSITPLPIMLEEADRRIYDKLEPPKTIVVRYGYQKLIAELPYSGDAKPGCGSKVVIRTDRGVELAEMLTTTCPNSGCGSAVSRADMLKYIQNSGGRDYPFTTQGRVLRMATIDDLNEQAALDRRKPDMIHHGRQLIREMNLDMRLVEVEPLLDGERILFYFTSEQYIDFRDLVKELAAKHSARIEMRQVNAREEARLVADYEKCGQHCCCKQFLKVLKPVSMKPAKIQKATLDPTKISGRCGRLMCCLRYEEQTYEDLRKRLPHKQTRVITEDGEGVVIGSQILTQLVLVLLDNQPAPQAYPLEDIQIKPKAKPEGDGKRKRRRKSSDEDGDAQASPGGEQRGRDQSARTTAADPSAEPDASSSGDSDPSGEAAAPNAPTDTVGREDVQTQRVTERAGDEASSAGSTRPAQAAPDASADDGAGDAPEAGGAGDSPTDGDGKPRRRRRRRGRGSRGGASADMDGSSSSDAGPNAAGGESAQGPASGGEGEGQTDGKPRRRRRRSRRRGGGGGGDAGASNDGGQSGSPDGGGGGPPSQG